MSTQQVDVRRNVNEELTPKQQETFNKIAEMRNEMREKLLNSETK